MTPRRHSCHKRTKSNEEAGNVQNRTGLNLTLIFGLLVLLSMGLGNAFGMELLSDNEMAGLVGEHTYHFMKYCDGPMSCPNPGCNEPTFECRRNPAVPSHCEGQYYVGDYGYCKGPAPGHNCEQWNKECWQRYWGDWYYREGQGWGCWSGCPFYHYGKCSTTNCAE